MLPVIGQVTNKRDLGGPGVWSLPNIPELSPAGGMPFNSKGKQVWEERRTQRASDPARACLPSGVPRIMYEPYSMEFLQLANRIVIVYEGGTHIFRSIPIGSKA